MHLGMTILPAGTGARVDPPRLGREWGAMFEDRDREGDKILFSKVGGAGKEKHSPLRPHPVPNIYNIIKYCF